MICTIQIATRLRPGRLMRTVQSVMDSANHPENIEFILRCDGDDSATIALIPDLVRMGNVRIIVGNSLGYAGYPRYHWEMCQLAEGEWIWWFDDDALVKESSKGWDDRLFDAPKTGFIVQPEINQLGGSGYQRDSSCPFFFLPNGWWKEFGIKQFDQPGDAWVFSQLREQRKWGTHYIPGLWILHERLFTDPLWKERNL